MPPSAVAPTHAPLPDAPAFVPDPLPGIGEGLRIVARHIAADPAAGLRFIGRTLWLVAAMALYVPLHYLWRALRRTSPWPRPFLAAAARACGVRVEVVGTPLTDKVFFIGNHLSWIDVPILGGITGTAFVAQDRIADWPLFGWLARLNNTVFVSRTDRMQVADQIAEIRQAVAIRGMLALFPEGTTTDGRSLLPFKTPLFATLVPPPPGVQIQTVLLDFDDAGRDLAWIGVETAPQNAWRVLTRKGTITCRVHFHAPFDPGEHANRKAVSAECRRRIAAALSDSLGGAPIA